MCIYIYIYTQQISSFVLTCILKISYIYIYIHVHVEGWRSDDGIEILNPLRFCRVLEGCLTVAGVSGCIV